MEPKIGSKRFEKFSLVIFDIISPSIFRTAVKITSYNDTVRIFTRHLGRHELEIIHEILEFNLTLTGTPVENCKKVFFIIQLNFAHDALREGHQVWPAICRECIFDIEAYTSPFYVIWVVAFEKRVTSEI